MKHVGKILDGMDHPHAQIQIHGNCIFKHAIHGFDVLDIPLFNAYMIKAGGVCVCAFPVSALFDIAIVVPIQKGSASVDCCNIFKKS